MITSGTAHRSWSSRYGVALLLTAIALMLRAALDAWLGAQLPLVTLFAAVALTVWYAGYGPAILAALLAFVGANFLFISPRYTPDLGALPTLPVLAAYVVACALIIVLGERARRHRQRQHRVAAERLAKESAIAGRERIEAELRASEARFRIAQDSSVVAFMILSAVRDETGAIVDFVWEYVNPAASRIVKRPVDELVGRRVLERLPSLRVKREPLDAYARVVETGEPADFEIVHDGDGVGGTFRNICSKLHDGVAVWFEDVTERRREEETRKLLAAVVESSDDAIVTKTVDGIITSWNAAASRLFGYTEEEAVGQPIQLIVPPERYDEEQRVLETLRRGERIDHFETVRVAKDGRLLEVSVTASPVRDAAGNVIGVSKVGRDITERKRLEAQLRETIDKLAAADRRKNEFLATLAHELRNPLAPIRNGLQILKLSLPSDEITKRTAQIMERQVNHLARLIDDLLDIGRITSGKVELRKRRLLLNEVLASALESCRTALDVRQHELIVEMGDEPLAVDGDPDRLMQVFSNLLSNAVKYTPAGGRICLSLRRQGSEAVVSVQDTGVGIPAEATDSIFEIFSQLRPEEPTESGLGIGLALVRQLVRMHGGSVSVQSPGAGRGSTFVARLPLAEVPASEAEKPAPTETEEAGHGRLRILVADDNEDAAGTLATMLSLDGHDVRVAHDGVEALDVAEELRPDVVLLDIRMPRLDGYATAVKLRERPWARRAYVVALTGWGQEQDKQRARDAGFDYHLTKPVERGVLERVLADAQVGAAARVHDIGEGRAVQRG